jgi:ATP-binding cassette subfamily B (MDR/TAP) protein 1
MIAVMQHGEIKELGSHDELIADESGLYSSLVRLQQTREPNEADEVSTSSLQQSRSHSMSRSSSARSLGDAGEADSIEEPKLPVPSFRRLLMLNAPEWRQALIGSLSAIAYGGIQPAFAYAKGSMLAVYFLTDHDEIRDKTRAYAFYFVALAVLSFLISIGQHYNFGAMGEYLTKRVREQMLTRILTFEIGWFDRDENSSGAICSQLAKDANVVSTRQQVRPRLL